MNLKSKIQSIFSRNHTPADRARTKDKKSEPSTMSLYHSDNTHTPQSAKTRLVVDLLRQTESLTRSDLARWRMAHQMAIDVENPQRGQLLRIYRDVELDGHLSGAIAQICGMVKARSFKLVNQQGEADENAVALLDTEWFKNTIDIFLQTRYWGFSLIQLSEPYDDIDGKRKFRYVDLIPREHVIPEYHRINRIAGDHWTSGYDWRESPAADTLLEVGTPTDLGLYLKCARYTIPKKNVEQYWDTFAEVFGMPMRIARTASRDDKDRDRILDMLEGMGHAMVAVMPEGTEVDVVENAKSDSFEVYDRRIERCDRELSKLVIGQTMTIEDGSSLSQSQTHLDVLKNLIEAQADSLRDFINGQLLPLMERSGFPVQGLHFEWDYPLDYTPEQMTAVENMILQHFDIDPAYFEDKYGIPATIRTIQNPPADPTNPPADPENPPADSPSSTSLYHSDHPSSHSSSVARDGIAKPPTDPAPPSIPYDLPGFFV